MEWIDVNDRLPEPMEFSDILSDEVLVISGYDTYWTAQYRFDKEVWVGDYGNYCSNITHWMPLPNPPARE